jgi:hypothetical protein
MAQLDGITLLLAKVKFKGKVIGLISEDGVEWGGNPPEYTEVVAAQTRSVVKKVLRRAGTIDLSFRLIELKVENLVDVMGGSADTATPGKWNAPKTPALQEGALEIETVTGQVISAANASLSGNVAGSIGGDDPLGVDCTASVLNNGADSPFSIDNTALPNG